MDIQKISADQSLFNVSKELHLNEIKDLIDTHHVSKFNLCHPISKDKLEINQNNINYEHHKIHIRDGIIDLSNLNI